MAGAVTDTTARIAAQVDGPVPEPTVAIVRDVLGEAEAQGNAIGDPALHSALADAVVLAPPSGTAELPDGEHGLLGSVRGGLRRIVSAVDSRLDQISPEALMDGMRHAIARTVRDVEAYERHGPAIRARLDEAYRAVRGRRGARRHRRAFARRSGRRRVAVRRTRR